MRTTLPIGLLLLAGCPGLEPLPSPIANAPQDETNLWPVNQSPAFPQNWNGPWVLYTGGGAAACIQIRDNAIVAYSVECTEEPIENAAPAYTWDHGYVWEGELPVSTGTLPFRLVAQPSPDALIITPDSYTTGTLTISGREVAVTIRRPPP